LFTEEINQILAQPIPSLMVVLNLILIESLLSLDNATVLAIMVRPLREDQRDKALKYGIIGAYVFRGLALVFASIIIKIWWLKPLGGLYLLYMVYDWRKGKQEKYEDEVHEVEKSAFHRILERYLGVFWTTVLMVELMDIAFSIDNVFAAVAFTPNILLVVIGVFIGILSMRFVAQYFNKLMNQFPFLETSAFIVIFILGLKLSFSVFEHFYPESNIIKAMTSHTAETILSLMTALIFFVPLVTSKFFNIPKRG
jgi:YkoY family integral membrane protein